ncbi:hypothetical protein [Paraburkholderia domus]|uniref:hypothetical protein n=1 Tax=Paraburkholderia domus TaxID=2793075 RepID=UPI001912392C|nr:hypothetical protein [Paraburkholderia domus]MBK5064831.1 hypothetical protein [Burkholderia sp. R-70199]CAE6967394.1 hypothetical protein R70199_07840 [Paraburkholderia domus]
MLALTLNRTVVARVRRILGWTCGGVHKRIDENIELLELLRDRAPDFLEQHPWVVNWFESHDEFLRQLASAVPLKEGFFLPLVTRPDASFPRTFPSGTPNATRSHQSDPH